MPETPLRPIQPPKPSNINTGPQQGAPPSGDLIDFGDELMTPRVQASNPNVKPIGENTASLMELQSPLLKRQDTETKSVDEFVDAEP